MSTKDFLIEIGCEELPAGAQTSLAAHLAKALTQAFDDAKLEHGEAQIFAAPRRLAVLISNVTATQPARTIERQGPSVESAYDKSGTPTLACLGFAKSCGVSADQLGIQDTPKGKRIFCKVAHPGKQTNELLPEIVQSALKKLPSPKPMRWGNNDIRFIRPVHWVLLLFGRDVIYTELFGLKTTRETRGHRFHHPRPIPITHPKDYNVVLYSQGYVVPDFQTRKDLIRKQIDKAVGHNQQAIVDENLLEEVTGLVEWPVVQKGSFNPDFLNVPKEVLITSMQTHQKCFPIEHTDGTLAPQFLLVSNIESKDPALVTQGNEKVINARLSDAAFFYDNDLKHPLPSYLPTLNKVIFQHKLGSLGDKTKRTQKLAEHISKKLGADTPLVKRAAQLSKCDLLTEMVYEFPSLQGVMGCYYALNEGEDPEVAQAIKEHYLPAFSGDRLPETLTGAIVSLADRLDTLVGIFGINQIPTGDKDPFALRRNALGILRILIEKELPLDLMALLTQTQKGYANILPNDKVIEQCLEFIMSRLKSWYLEQRVAPEIFESVLAINPKSPLDFHHRVQAVRQFQTLPESSALAAANKRVSNILKKQDEKLPTKTDAALFECEEERVLAKCLDTQSEEVTTLYQNADYTTALTKLSTLKEPVDAFFDQVMIMDKDAKKRRNRLALLVSLRKLFTQVADISLLP